MNILSYLPFSRRPEAPSAPRAGLGPLTGCDLSRADALALPFAPDPFFRLRPPFSKEAAQMSLELADMTYTLELDAWKDAGWTDFSILIDDSLQSGLTHWESGDALSGVINRIKLLRAKAALLEPSPVSQLLSALRQKEKSDTVKAVCMMHPLPGDRWLVAIGFMGTGKRFYDWFSNFRFTPEEGFHKGFSQLCESFEMQLDDIVFPAAAEALGLEKLTLGHVLSDMRSLSSRFRLWMAGHSQGGAVMQVFAHRLMTDWGVLPQNMVGYGFASPTVATGKFVYDPAAYPLYHILNADDVVPKLGALLHLGLCAQFEPDEAFRQSVYPKPGPSDAELQNKLAFFTAGITDTPTAILHMTTLLETLSQEKGAEGLEELMNSWWSVGAVDRAIGRAGNRAMEYLNRLLAGAREGYEALTRHPADEQTIAQLRERLRPIVRETSVRRLMNALTEPLVPPHALSEGGRGAYTLITRDLFARLEPFIWIKVPGGMPVRRYGLWTDAPLASVQTFSALRRSCTRSMRLKSKLRLSHSYQKNACTKG